MSDKYTNNFVRCVLAAIDVPSLQKSSPSLELNHLLPEIINSVVLGSFCSILLNVSLLTLSIVCFDRWVPTVGQRMCVVQSKGNLLTCDIVSLVPGYRHCLSRSLFVGRF